MLLHWCTLEPAGPSNLAAIRFSSPVCVKSIRIYPSGSVPFSASPETEARTAPEEFYLQIFFNAHGISPIIKQKQKANNALVPTSLAYAGGLRTYDVDMGNDYATRLMIVKGNFQSVSMAIYGDVASEMPPMLPSYDIKPLPTFEAHPLPPPLDPANSVDPTELARSVLTATPDISLELAVQIMFSLKPPADDWDEPDFPHLYANFSEVDGLDDIDRVLAFTSRPLPSAVTESQLCELARKAQEALAATTIGRAHAAATLLRNSSSQKREMAITFIDKLDLSSALLASDMNEATLLCLLEATANPDIARALSDEWFSAVLGSVEEPWNSDEHRRAAARKLRNRIHSWHLLEDALSNTQGDFDAAAKMLRDMGTDGLSFGTWLSVMIGFDELTARLYENPALPMSQNRPALMLAEYPPIVSHDEFIEFLRAYIGVACVLVVYAWADSLPHGKCRERTLAIVRHWQQIDGYREIVNHLLLLPQLTYRLECMIDPDPPRVPTVATIEAENIILNLTGSPDSFLARGVTECILSLRQPLTCISEEVCASLRPIALMVDDGLSAALDVITGVEYAALDSQALFTLRVALAMLKRELNDVSERGDPVLSTLWEQGYHGVTSRLADAFVVISSHLTEQYNLSLPSRVGSTYLLHLLSAAHSLLSLLSRLIADCPMPARTMRTLIAAVADVFVCTDAIDMILSQSNPACTAAQACRQACIHLGRCLAEAAPEPEGAALPAKVVLETLLQHALRSDKRDPSHHVLQVFFLIDHILPLPDDMVDDRPPWFSSVVPMLLLDLKSFFMALDPENQAHLVKRLVSLDDGRTGVGEWLLLQDMKHLLWLLRKWDTSSSDARREIDGYEISSCLQFISYLASPTSSSSSWFMNTIAKSTETSGLLANCLFALLDRRLSSMPALELAQTLESRPSENSPQLVSAVAATLLRAAQDPSGTAESLLVLAHATMKAGTPQINEGARLTNEIGSAMSVLAEGGTDVSSNLAEVVMDIHEWLLEQVEHISLPVASTAEYRAFCDRVAANLLPDYATRFNEYRKRIDTQDIGPIPPNTPLPESISLPITQLQTVMQSGPALPSTPVQKPTTHTEDAFGFVTVSPPTSLLRSPVVSTGKIYLGDNFRSARSGIANTSRLPSMHVDAFELNASSPPLPALAGGIPVSAFPTDNYGSLGPPFNVTQ